MGEVEAKMIRGDQRSGLLYVLAEDFAQSSMQKMGGGVVAHGRLAYFGIDDCVHIVAWDKCPPGNHAVRSNPLNGEVAARHFSDYFFTLCIQQPTHIPDLTSRFGVETRVIQNYVGLLALFNAMSRDPVLDDIFH